MKSGCILTRAMRPAPTPINGLAAMMTSVSFHPFTNPMEKPHTNVVKRWTNMATWSAMASLILFMSLLRQTRTSVSQTPGLQPAGSTHPSRLTLTYECWAPRQRCSQTSRSPSSSLCWSTFFWWAESVWQRLSPTERSVSGFEGGHSYVWSELGSEELHLFYMNLFTKAFLKLFHN